MYEASSPSEWVVRFAPLVAEDAVVLDVAAGGGRHTRSFLERGNRVVAVDIEVTGLEDLAGHPRLELVQADLERGEWPLGSRSFGAVVVTNYLHRPLLPRLIAAVGPAGVLIYETFARGNERFGRPTNPDYLVEPGELRAAVAGELRVVAYEEVVVDDPRPAALQRICALRDRVPGSALEGPIEPHPEIP